MRTSLIVVALAVALAISSAHGQSFQTPAKVKSRMGDLRFKDGVPDAATTQKLYDELDYIRAVEAFINGYPAVSQLAIRKAFISAGVNDNDFLVCSELMDSKSIFLTPNCDTYYLWSFLDLTKGPLVLEVPPGILGLIDDMWWKWIGDCGLPGPDRGEGGKYVILPPGYKGPLPEGGYFVYQSNTNQCSIIGRAFLENDDPKPIDERVKRTLKIYPYVPGSMGSSMGGFLTGRGPLAPLSAPASPKFVEGTGREMNTIPPTDYSYFELLNEAIQSQPAEALDPEIAGQCAAIGIVKGQPFNPDARMKKILTEAAAVGNAASRAVMVDPRASEGFNYYGGTSNWTNSLFTGGYEFLTPPPDITREGIKPYPSDGARKLNSRTWFFYLATGITPAMCMRMENAGSTYLAGFFDDKDQPLDGNKTYKVTLPADIPAGRFWSFTVYDNQTRSLLQTPQRYPRAGSQGYPSPAAKPNDDGTITVYFGPKIPNGVERGNWIQTMPGRGWFTILRLYSPLGPFFAKTWQPSEIVSVK